MSKVEETLDAIEVKTIKKALKKAFEKSPESEARELIGIMHYLSMTSNPRINVTSRKNLVEMLDELTFSIGNNVVLKLKVRYADIV